MNFNKKNQESMRPEDLACSEEIKAIFKEFNEDHKKKRKYCLI